MAFQGGLLLPGDDGRVYLIDPETGESRAEPFIPPFDRTRPTLWRAPVAIGADAFGLVDEAGHIRKIAIVSDPRPRLVAAIEEKLSKDIVADPAADLNIEETLRHLDAPRRKYAGAILNSAGRAR